MTVDDYFTGARPDIQSANVWSTIESYMHELIRDPKKRFTQVEMKFFSMWVDRQDKEMLGEV